MPRPRTITDADISEAARAVFVEHGPGAPVSLVAKQLGVTHAALFQRAGSKERLMRDALCPGQPAIIEDLVAQPPDAAARARLIALLDELMVFFRRVVPNLVVLRSAGLSMEAPEEPAVDPPPVLLRRLLTSWLSRATRRGALDVPNSAALAEGLLGAMEARCFNAYLGGPSFVPGDDLLFIEELVGGLVAEGKNASSKRTGGGPKKGKRK